jgi:hypothetical protein
MGHQIATMLPGLGPANAGAGGKIRGCASEGRGSGWWRASRGGGGALAGGDMGGREL